VLRSHWLWIENLVKAVLEVIYDAIRAVDQVCLVTALHLLHGDEAATGGGQSRTSGKETSTQQTSMLQRPAGCKRT
jgi:hypothetical protein